MRRPGACLRPDLAETSPGQLLRRVHTGGTVLLHPESPGQPNGDNVQTWCVNELTITGPTNKLAEFLATIGDGQSLLSTLVPTPPELLEHPAPVGDSQLAEKFRRLYGAADWYDWNETAWGVAHDVELQDIDDHLETRHGVPYLWIWFDSDEVPPLAALDTVAERYPELTLKLFYNEPEEDFSGDAVWAAGARVSLEEGPAFTWCQRCESRAPWTATFPPAEDVTTCIRCLLKHEAVIVDASMLVRAESRATLESVRAIVTDAATVEGLLSSDSATTLADFLTLCLEKAGGDFLWVEDDGISADSALHRLAFHTAYTSDGDLLVTYPSVYGDIGDAVWGGLSQDHPDATFQLTVKPRVNMGPAVFTYTLVDGDHITA